MTTWKSLDQQLLVGTYTQDTESQGIYLVTEEGDLICVAETENPSYICLHPNLPVVYCVNETQSFASQSATGAVSAFQFTDLSAGGIYLDLINQQPSMGADPCHLSVDPAGRFLLVSNYTGGSFASFGLEPNGYIESFQSLTTHSGNGPHPERQTSAHVHSSLLAHDLVYIADLGTDHLSSYQIDANGLIGESQKHTVCKPGAGPRFMAATDRHLFALNELNNTLVRYEISSREVLEEISIVPDETTANLAAHLCISRDQQTLYLTNRGFDTISVFSIEPALKHIQTLPTGGEHPRHFSLINDEQHLVVANQHSDSLVLFARDPATGMLSKTDLSFYVPAPSYVCEINKAP